MRRFTAGLVTAMQAESAYLTQLGSIASYEATADKLTLYDGNGNVSLVFEGVEK